MAIKKMCPRCRRVINYNQRWCVECTARMNKDYDKTRRDRNSKAFYSSKEWLKVRGIVISKYNGLDLYALLVEGTILYADTVHHIEELKAYPARALDMHNLIPLSSSTHARMHKVYDKGGQDKQAMQKLLFELINTQPTV